MLCIFVTSIRCECVTGHACCVYLLPLFVLSMSLVTCCVYLLPLIVLSMSLVMCCIYLLPLFVVSVSLVTCCVYLCFDIWSRTSIRCECVTGHVLCIFVTSIRFELWSRVVYICYLYVLSHCSCVVYICYLYSL